MKEEIETILQCDAAARQKLEFAKAEAEAIGHQAREEIEKIEADQELKKVELLQKEREAILSEARSKAQEILDQAGLYLERASRKKTAEWEKLMAHLLLEVTRR
jgi:hypothetical protein